MELISSRRRLALRLIEAAVGAAEPFQVLASCAVLKQGDPTEDQDYDVVQGQLKDLMAAHEPCPFEMLIPGCLVQFKDGTFGILWQHVDERLGGTSEPVVFLFAATNYGVVPVTPENFAAAVDPFPAGL